MHPPQQHKFGFKAWIPTIGLAFAAFVFNTSEFLPVGLLPNIAESIHESVSKTGLIITVYAWVVSLLSLPLTILTAKLERRRLLLWLIVIFALSHFVVLWADTFEKLMGARICVAVTHSSAEFESFQDNLLEYPQYSRPEVWHGKQVPEVLLSGHHANIEKWRRRESVIRTAKNRPDLLARADLTEEERTLARKILEETGKA